MPICELMQSGYSSSSYSWPPHESSYDSLSPLWSRSDHHLEPKSSSLQNLSIRKKSSLDDVMQDFQMNGSDSPYNPEDNLFWSRQSAPGELSGLGPGATYLRQKSWPAPERSPAARLPARARPRSLHEPRWDYAEAKFAASMPISYENEAKFAVSMPVSYKNEAKFAASMPVSYENEAKFAASMPVSYENEAKFAPAMSSYEGETKFAGNENKFATSVPMPYGTESKFATSTPIFDDVPLAPFLPAEDARALTGEQARALTGEQARALTGEQARVLHSLPDGVLYSLLRGIRAERRANTPQECRFCKNNGERQAFYRSHSLKDAAGRVSCPVLRAFVCRRCGARGDAAHTIKYCPYSTNEERIQSAGLVHSMRMASGRRRQQRVAPSGVEMSDYIGVGEAAPSILPEKNVYNSWELDPIWAALEQKLSLH